MYYHLEAKPEDVSENVIVCGDPARVELLSTLLSECKLVNTTRGYLMYTGNFKGKKVTIACHGIGSPSIALLIEELVRRYNVKRVIRFGTTGSFYEDIDVGTIVLPEGAIYEVGTLVNQYVGKDIAYPAIPSIDLLVKIEEKLKKFSLRYVRGIIYTTDKFFVDDLKNYVNYWRSRKAISVEMECAILFTLAKLKGIEAAAVLIVSNNLATGRIATFSELKEIFINVGKAILEVLSEY